MEHRAVDQIAVIGGDEGPAFGACIGEQMQIGGQHPLGRPRGARGEDDRHGIPWLDRAGQGGKRACRRQQRVFIGDGGQGGLTRRAAHHDQLFQLAGVDPFQPVGQAGMDHGHARIRDVDDMRQKIAAIGGVDRHIDRAQIVQRKEDADLFAAVGGKDQHMIALRHALLLQADGGLDDLVAEIGIGPCLAVIVEDDEGTVGLLFSQPVDQVAGHDTVAGGHARVGGLGSVGAGCDCEHSFPP